MSLTQSACLPPPSHIQSVSMLSLTYLMVFIYLFHVWFWCCPPLWCGVKYLQGFCFGLYWVGLWWVQTCHLYHIEASQTGNIAWEAEPLAPSSLFIFILEWGSGSFALPEKTTLRRGQERGREEKWGRWKQMGREWEQREERCRRNERWLTGGTQLANHRGSCDAGVASLPFSQRRKLKVHCLIVPFKTTPQKCLHKPYEHTCTATPQVAHCQRPAPLRWSHPAKCQSRCYNPLPDTPSALWTNSDPLPALLNPPVQSPGSIWTQLCQSSLFICLRLDIYWEQFAHIAAEGERSLLLFGSSRSVLLRSVQTLRTLGTQQSCVVAPGLPRPMGMPVSWRKACLLNSLSLSVTLWQYISVCQSVSLPFSHSVDL